MADSVEVIESARDRDAVENRIQQWLDNNSGSITSLDEVEPVYEMNNRVGLAMLDTA